MGIEIYFMILCKQLHTLRPDSQMLIWLKQSVKFIYCILLFFLNFAKLTNFKQNCFYNFIIQYSDKIGYQKRNYC